MKPVWFYVAASSSAKDMAKACMRDLESLGMRNTMDWTANLTALEWEWPGLARIDIDSASEADVCVLLAEPPSYGAHVEAGARLGAGKTLHVVGEGFHPFFGKHPLVTHYASWRNFIESAEGRSE